MKSSLHSGRLWVIVSTEVKGPPGIAKRVLSCSYRKTVGAKLAAVITLERNSSRWLPTQACPQIQDYWVHIHEDGETDDGAKMTKEHEEGIIEEEEEIRDIEWQKYRTWRKRNTETTRWIQILVVISTNNLVRLTIKNKWVLFNDT